ncbi:MAG: HNH endonuclease [Gemmatimonadetes bacterium]|nr:MAG: HNH endonuclease [Gemmatimonadota bacterium]
MVGTVAITDPAWYRVLRESGFDEVNFWKPSARQAFKADEFSPFFFKLPKPHYAICGFGFFVRFATLPVWLAWETFGRANGCESLDELEDRIRRHRERFRYTPRPGSRDNEIGCIVIMNPIFLPEDRWVAQPVDWPKHGQRPKRYDLTRGEGERVWRECLEAAEAMVPPRVLRETTSADGERYGAPWFAPRRLGQAAFRIAVTEAYERACALTGEHSLPVLEAAHIRPYARGGVHEVPNGLLLRADLHKLFDRGYLTVTPDYRVRVSARLREEYDNGRTYYPLDGARVRVPEDRAARPDRALLEWHSTEVFAA